jgi:hypothetical protein
MAMNTKAVFIHPVDIVVFAYVDAIAIMVEITAPDEIVVPEGLLVIQIIGKESVGTEDCRRERDLLREFVGEFGTRGFKDILLEEIPAVFEFGVEERLVEVPVLVVETGFLLLGIDAEDFAEVTQSDRYVRDGWDTHYQDIILGVLFQIGLFVI